MKIVGCGTHAVLERIQFDRAITDAVSAPCVPSCQLCTPHVDIQLRLKAVHIAAPPTLSAADHQRAYSSVTGIEKQEHIS